MSSLTTTDFAVRQGDAAVNAQGDLFLVAGMDNLIESLKRRLRTRVRALFYAPTYGNPAITLLSQPMTQDFEARFTGLTTECLMQDRRVASATVTTEIILESRIVRCSIEIRAGTGESGSFEEVSRFV